VMDECRLSATNPINSVEIVRSNLDNVDRIEHDLVSSVWLRRGAAWGIREANGACPTGCESWLGAW
jgi:hypothetical protein